MKMYLKNIKMKKSKQVKEATSKKNTWSQDS